MHVLRSGLKVLLLFSGEEAEKTGSEPKGKRSAASKKTVASAKKGFVFIFDDHTDSSIFYSIVIHVACLAVSICSTHCRLEYACYA